MMDKKPIAVIPALYKAKYEDILLFGWVEGQKRLFPTMSVEQSLSLFIHHFGGDYDIDCLRVTYGRMQKKYYAAQKL